MSDDNKHAVYSPSGASRWMQCIGSVALSKDVPRRSSKYAEAGTLAHAVAASILLGAEPIGHDPAILPYVYSYVDLVKMLAEGGQLLVEQSVPIDHLTGEADACGTADAVIIRDNEIIVVDLKAGAGVRVEAENNPQLMMYALGAVAKFATLGDFKTARLIISQPYLNSVSEWVCTIEELEAFGKEVRAAAAEAMAAFDLPYEQLLETLSPDAKTCRFCASSATCPMLAAQVFKTVSDDFEDLTQLAKTTAVVTVPQLDAALERVKMSSDEKLDELFPMLDLIDKWVLSVRAQVESRLFAGAKLNNVKLVQGRRGDRKWVDTTEVENVLKSARLSSADIYETKVISPVKAEKLLAKDHPRYWKKLQELITQPEGKPSVALMGDKRPAFTLNAVVDDFEVIGAEDLT